MAWSTKGAESPSESSPSEDSEAKRNLQERTSALNKLQKLLREVTKYLLILKTALAASSARFAPTWWAQTLGGSPSSAWGVIRASPELCGDCRHSLGSFCSASSLYSPASSLPHPSHCRPSCPAKHPGSSSQSTARHRGGQWPLHSTPAPIPHHTWMGIAGLEEIKYPTTTAGNPSRQAGRGIHSL